MPRISSIDMNHITQSIASDIQKNLKGQFIRFLDGATPAFCTVYTMNNNETTGEIGSYKVDDYIGYNSPVKYNKVFNYPFFNFAPIVSEIQFDEEKGSYNEYETTIQSVPMDLDINIYDCIVYPLLPDVLFTVTDISDHNLTTMGYKEITISILRTGKEIPLIEKQVTDKYTCLYENVGTQDKVIMKLDDYDKAKDLQTFYNLIGDVFIQKYFDDYRSSLFELNRDNDVVTYIDPMLHIFLKNSTILTSDKNFEKRLYFDDKHLYNKNEYNYYPKSLYYDIVNGHFLKNLEANKYSYFDYLEEFYDITGNSRTAQKVLKIRDYYSEDADGRIELIPVAIRDNIVNKTPTNFIESVLSMYLHKDTFDLDKFCSLFNPSIYEELYSDKTYHYFLFPLTLYVMKETLKIFESKL